MEHASGQESRQLSWAELDVEEHLSALTFVIVDLEKKISPAESQRDLALAYSPGVA